MGSHLTLRKEPEYSDFIYEEIRQCEEYALMNMITFEAAIRNSEVKKILSELDSASSSQQLDSIFESNDIYLDLIRKLKEDYYLDYYEYHTYAINKKDFLDGHTPKSSSLGEEIQAKANKIQAEYEYVDSKTAPTVIEQVFLYKKYNNRHLHVSHDKDTSHTHHLSLPLYRPKMNSPQANSSISIQVPMYHIHPKDIKAYYKRLAEEHENLLKEVQEYYEIKELFFDETEEKKNKSEIYSKMFFVWDYVQWWLEKYDGFTPDMTAGSLYYEIGQKIGFDPHPDTGRNASVEKYLENMKKLINHTGYKRFYEWEHSKK